MIFDDVNMDKRDPEEKIGVVDLANDSDQRVLYGTVKLPAEMPRVILSNKGLKEYFGANGLYGMGEAQLEAILRRVRDIDLGNKKLIIRQINELEFQEKDS